MVFSSVPPAYLDPPNWNQQQVHHGHLQPVTPPGLMASRTDVAVSGSVASGSSARPGSMSERARLAKIPQPEPGLKCPRCESSNTKFCYFNNYSLSQPRHFCKTCRRYWTRGGALRSVPVGGGCRRNKRSGKSSKSSSSSTNTTASASASANGGTSSSTSSAATGCGAAAAVQTQPQLPFLASLHSIGSDHFSSGVPRLGFPGLSPLHPVDYHLAGAGGLALDHWRLSQMQQIPFLSQANVAAAPAMAGIYPFDTEGGTDGGGLAGQMLASAKAPSGGSAGLITQLASVKMEDNPPSAITGLGLSGSFQFWSGGNGDGGAGDGNRAGGSTASGSSGGGVALGGAWADMPAFNSLGNIL